MADVTGQFGQEDIQLNNAATEATLKAILEYQKVIAASAAQGFKSGKDLDAAIRGLAQKTRDAAEAGKDFTKSTKRSYKAHQEATDAVEDYSDALEASKSKLSTFATILKKTANGALYLLETASKAASGISSMDGSLANATSTIASMGSDLPGVGAGMKALSATFGPTVQSLDRTRSAFQEAASVGANFGGNLNGAVKAAGQMGLQLEQLTGLISNNGEALMMLGGDTATGAKRLQEFGREFKKTPMFDDLARLGYSTEDMNEGFLNYSKMLAKNGRLEGMSQDQLRKGTYDYMRNLDAVSKLTGKSKDALQAEEDARQADAQYRIMMSKLDEDGQKQMELLMKSIPKQHQAGLKEILATGTATSEEGIKALAFLKESGMSAQQLHQQMNATGTLTADQVKGFNATYQAEADKLAKSPLMETLGKFDPAANDFVVGVLDVAARTKTLATVYDETQTILDQIKDDIAKGIETDLVDPATIEDFRNKINTAAATMTEQLNAIDITPLSKAFDAVNAAAQTIAPKVLETAAGNFPKVAGAIAGMELAAKAAEIALYAMAAAAGMNSLPGLGRKGKPLRGPKNVPKNVKPPGAAGNMLKGAGKLAAKGLRFLPGVGLVAMAGMAAAEGFSAGYNAEEYLGLDEGEAATAGERTAATVGGILDSLTFGLVDGEKVAKSLVNMTGAGVNTMEEYEEQIAKEKARLERSMSGENEYGVMDGGFGSESYGQAQSRIKIAEMEKKIAEIKAEELKKQQEAGNAMPAEFSEGTSGALGKLFGNFGSGTPAMLHGLEAVVTPSQMAEVVASGIKGTINSIMTAGQSALTADTETTDVASTVQNASQQAVSDMKSETTMSPQEQMAELNNSIQELVNLTRMSNSLHQKHIGVTQGLSSDAFNV